MLYDYFLYFQKVVMDLLLTSLAFLLVLLHHVTEFTHGTCHSSNSDVILKDHVIYSLPSADLSDCWLKCQNEVRCQSLNYFVKRQLCEINNMTIKRAPKSIVGITYTVYVDNPLWGEFLDQKKKIE